MFTPRDEPHHNLFYSRDPEAIARAKGWGAVAPYYIEQESPQLAGAPRAGPLVVKLPNNHLQYAITWFGLALALAGIYLVWLRGRLRRP
jgi:cytochrome oxidase assembly protein ShyY1